MTTQATTRKRIGTDPSQSWTTRITSRLTVDFLGILTLLAAVTLFCSASSVEGANIRPGNLLVPNEGLNSVQEFDPLTFTVTQSFELPEPFSYNSGGARLMWSVLVSSDDHKIILNVKDQLGSPALLVLSRDGELLSEHSGGIAELQEMAFDPLDPSENTVLGGGPFSSEVSAFNSMTGDSSARIVESSLDAIAVTTNDLGQIYVSDRMTSSILLYDSQGNRLRVFADVGTTAGKVPHSLGIDGDGNVFVAAGDRILKYNSSGDLELTMTNQHFSAVTHLFLNPDDGLIYAANEGDDLLMILTPSGEQVAMVSLGGGSSLGKAALIPCLPAEEGTQMAKLAASDPVTQARFGTAVAVEHYSSHPYNRLVVIGAPASESSNGLAGSATVVIAKDDYWQGRQQVKLAASDEMPNNLFGFAVGVSASTLAIGAPGDLYASGAVYIYNGPTSETKLSASDGAIGDQFGFAVSIDGGTVAAGALRATGHEANSGAVYLYQAADGQGDWFNSGETKIVASDGHSIDGFGHSVALSESTLVVGAPFADLETGAVYLYLDTSAEADWSSVTETRISPSFQDLHFGSSVAISGPTVVVGAFENDNSSGAVYVFHDTSRERDWSSFTETRIVPSDEDDTFGSAVAISGSAIVVGAYGSDPVCRDSGSVYVYKNTSLKRDWSTFTEARLNPPDAQRWDRFGRSVAIWGSTVVVGSHRDDDSNVDSGSAYAFATGPTMELPFVRNPASTW